MAKCGKGCMPECEYFTTGGCISLFSCPYKIETGYINSATSTTDSLTGLLIEFDEMGFCPTTVCPNPEQTAIEWKEQVVKEIQKLQAENAELRERLNRAGGLPCKVGDTLYEPLIDSIREWVVDSIYVFFLGINVNCERKGDYGWRDHFAIRENYNDFESRVYLTREAAEARLKEIKEENND